MVRNYIKTQIVQKIINDKIKNSFSKDIKIEKNKLIFHNFLQLIEIKINQHIVQFKM
jgi:hypothetical protein